MGLLTSSWDSDSTGTDRLILESKLVSLTYSSTCNGWGLSVLLLALC